MNTLKPFTKLKASPLQNNSTTGGNTSAGLPEIIPSSWPEEARKMLHDLRNRQIELVKQNEDLRRAMTKAEKAAFEDKKELQKFDAFLSKLLDAVLIPIFYKDQTGCFVFINRAFEKLFGVTKEQIVGRHLLDIHPPHKSAKYHHAKDIALLATPGESVYEARVHDAQGQSHDVIFHKATMVNAAGEITGLVAAILDITKRKRVEKALQENEKKLRTILRTAMDGFWKADMQGRILEVSETYCRMSGYSEAELLTMNISDLEINETAEDIIAHNRKIELQGEDRFESRHRRKDGSIMDVEVSVQHRRIDGSGGNIAFLRDITEKKRSEAALHEANAILHAALDQSVAGIAIANAPDGIIRYVNDAGLRYRGGKREDFINKIGIHQYVDTWGLLDLDGRRLKTEEVPLARAILFGETSSREILSHRSADDHRIILANAAPITDASGNISAAVVVFVDITEQKRSEERLRLLSSRLLTAQEDEQNRIAMELHDQAGQDLSVLKLHLATIQKRLRKDQAKLKKEFSHVMTFTDGIIEDIRRLAHGLSPRILQEVGLNAALRALIRNFSEKARIPICFEMEELDTVLRLETQVVLYRIFQEALTNIYKHAQAQRVTITGGREGETILFKIQDNGRGFDPCRLAGGNHDSGRGMGVDAMALRAGMINAEMKILSLPGQGTEIQLRVPLHHTAC